MTSFLLPGMLSTFPHPPPHTPCPPDSPVPHTGQPKLGGGSADCRAMAVALLVHAHGTETRKGALRIKACLGTAHTGVPGHSACRHARALRMSACQGTALQRAQGRGACFASLSSSAAAMSPAHWCHLKQRARNHLRYYAFPVRDR